MKKSHYSLVVRLIEQFSLIEKLKKSHSITMLCKILGVHRSSYKYWQRRPKSISIELIKLRCLIKEVHAASNGSAGARSIAGMVTAQGIGLSRYRTSKLMKGLNLVSCQSPKHRYRKAKQEYIAIPNHLDRQFAVTSPNQVWVSDVTYVWTRNRWIYLAVVVDLFSRKPVGWAMSLSPDSRLTGKALLMAYESQHKPKDVMFHSDQGSHYTSHYYR